MFLESCALLNTLRGSWRVPLHEGKPQGCITGLGAHQYKSAETRAVSQGN